MQISKIIVILKIGNDDNIICTLNVCNKCI